MDHCCSHLPGIDSSSNKISTTNNRLHKMVSSMIIIQLVFMLYSVFQRIIHTMVVNLSSVHELNHINLP